MADPHYAPASPTPTTTPADAMAAISSAIRSEPVNLQCCCGRSDCVFLKHNCSALESVEKDVHTAAKLGQILLARHEAYMADAERDRVELTARIDLLELDKKGLEAQNAKTIEENRALLDQLEALNSTVADSEVRITSLEATLQSSQLSVRRLEGAAVRASQLERELEFLEREQEKLQGDLFNSQRDARTAIQRWKTAERGISNLQEQLERMEQEAREERARHAEFVERMEEQRAMEKGLDAAAGRLKGAAAAKSLGNGKNTNPVVSHFVRDLLQDNANMQLGIAELRELLMNSNDEIQILREQLMHHQPVVDGEASAASTLRAELEPQETRESIEAREVPHRPQHMSKVSQELHIHHHYHVKPVEPKKPKKKRQGLSTSIFTPPTRSPSTPPGLGQWRLSQASPAPGLLSQGGHQHSDSVSTVPSNRWSLFSDNPSDLAPSSVPTSPRSNPRNSMFGRSMLDDSLPGSPLTSADPMSPAWEYSHRKHASDVSARSFQQPSHFPPPPIVRRLQQPSTPEPISSPQTTHSHTHASSSTTPYAGSGAEDQDIPDLITTGASTDGSTTVSDTASLLSFTHHNPGDNVFTFPTVSTTPSIHEDDLSSSMTPTTSTHRPAAAPPPPRPPTLRRTASHDSVMSLAGGLEIHTLKARPSQLTLRHIGTPAAAMADLSAVTARPTISRAALDGGKRGSVVLRDSLSLGLPLPRTRVASAGVGPRSASPSDGGGGLTPRQSSALGRLASWRPWGSPVITTASPSSALEEAAAATAAPLLSPSTASSSSAGPRSPLGARSPRDQQKQCHPHDLARPPGINQAGAIPGFQEYFAAHQRRGPPSKVTPDSVDREALREVLEGG